MSCYATSSGSGSLRPALATPTDLEAHRPRLWTAAAHASAFAWRERLLGFALLLASTSCTTTYAYRFQLTDPGARLAKTPSDRDVLEDKDVKAEVQISDGAILLDLTNKTDEVLQVEWSKIALDRGDGTRSAPRPDVDMGWIQPGAKAAARLVPLALPRSGKAAAAYEQRHLELDVPLILRHEANVYRLHFIAHVQAL